MKKKKNKKPFEVDTVSSVFCIRELAYETYKEYKKSLCETMGCNLRKGEFIGRLLVTGIRELKKNPKEFCENSNFSLDGDKDDVKL